MLCGYFTPSTRAFVFDFTRAFVFAFWISKLATLSAAPRSHFAAIVHTQETTSIEPGNLAHKFGSLKLAQRY